MSFESWHTAKTECTLFLHNHDENSKKCRSVTEDKVYDLPDHQLNEERQQSTNAIKTDCKFVEQLYQWKTPWIILLISATQIVGYFVACKDSIEVLMFKPWLKYDLWRIFTYHLIHSSLTHLLLNVSLQIIIAIPLEMEQGHFRTGIVYFAAVVYGALGSSFFNSSQALVGSSAGVYGLLGSHLSHCILNWKTLRRRKFRLVSVLLLIGNDLLFTTLRRINWLDIGPKVSISAHISGFVGSFFTALMIFSKN